MVLSVKSLTHLSRFAPLKVRQIYRSQEGHMAPKPEPAGLASVLGTLTSVFGIVLAVAAILVIMVDRDLAQPSLPPIYHPQLLLLY